MREGLRSSDVGVKLENDQVDVENNVDSGPMEGVGVIDNVDDEKKGTDLVSDDVDFVKDSLVSFTDGKIEGQSEHMECENAVGVNVGVNSDTPRPKAGRGRPRKKRKMVEDGYNNEKDKVDLALKKGDETTNTSDNKQQGQVPVLSAPESTTEMGLRTLNMSNAMKLPMLMVMVKPTQVGLRLGEVEGGGKEKLWRVLWPMGMMLHRKRRLIRCLWMVRMSLLVGY
ncbi:hypothetical protein CsSME_00047116 [Camellia sinensis var. sinensis]